jgi:hypothetical protein
VAVGEPLVKVGVTVGVLVGMGAGVTVQAADPV